MMMLSPQERRMRLGLDFTKGLSIGETVPYQETYATVPASFDWRNIDEKGTSYVTPIRNQTDGTYTQTGFVVGTVYKVTPSKSGYSFTPTYTIFDNGNANLGFTGTQKAKGGNRKQNR